MAADTKYVNLPWIFESKGVMSRPANDRPPSEHFYLDMAGTFEREESALSSRYGSTIINRDPNGTPSGVNYPFPSKPIVLSRLKSLNGEVFRYAALADGTLWRRAGDTQGPYTQIASGLSGDRFSTLVNTCFGSSQPFLFLYDRVLQLKDSGIGSPSRIGIFPPTQPVIATQYGPEFLPIDTFQSSAGYAPSGMTLSGITTVATVAGTAGTSVLNYEQYTDTSGSFKDAIDGMVATSTAELDGQLRLKFNTNGPLQTYDIISPANAYSGSDTFKFKAVSFTIASNTTGHIGKSLPLDLSAYQTEDLIVLVVQVDGAAAVQEIRLEFDVDGSGYSSSYYYKSIIPVSYQGSLSLPQVNDPVNAVGNAVSEGSIGINGQWNPGGWFQLLADPSFKKAQQQNNDDNNLTGIQPSQFASGDGPWSVIYLRKGDFQPVGNANTPGLDWSNITGWRVQVTTNSQGSATLAFNGLYIQGSPTADGIGTDAGPSSFGGIGYDFVYTYYNVNTRTESNPCPIPKFSITPLNPGGVSTLVVLRQAIDAVLQYSADPQVTHVRIYARGGAVADTFFYADQIPNVTGTSQVHYQYILPDAARQQGNPVSLINDVPVTSTLQQPIDTTLTGPIGPPPNTNVPTLQAITVADGGAVFVPTQIVVIGTPQNLEQVYVVVGGVGSFTAYVQLPHDAGEQVQVFSIPGQPCFLAAFAYGQTWLTGDPNNPHLVYYTPNSLPENCPPQNYIPVESAGDPNTAIINFRGALFARTMSTWRSIFPGKPPYAQSTGSKHGSPANFDWCITESEIWYQSWDGIRSFRGADGPYRSLIIEWLYRNNNLSLIPLVDLDDLGDVISAFKNNTATFVYPGQDGSNHEIQFSTSYNRWRNDNQDISALYLELDTNTLVYSTPDGVPTVDSVEIISVKQTFPFPGTHFVLELTLRNPPPFAVGDSITLTDLVGASFMNGTTWPIESIDGNVVTCFTSSGHGHYPQTPDSGLMTGAVPTGYLIRYEDITKDYDDGGWVAGVLTQLPILMSVQTPYLDQNLPNNQKQYNSLTIDANPMGQTVTVTLLFDDDNGTIAPIVVGTMTGSLRQKFNFQINAAAAPEPGLGQPAYRISLKLTCPVLVAPILYQADIDAAPLPDQRNVLDSYWIKFGFDESKLVKQIYIDYTTTDGNPITVNVFADGNPVPYYTFTLPANAARAEVPMRVRLPALKLRQLRVVSTSVGGFQIWAPMQVDVKPIQKGKGYAPMDIVGAGGGAAS